MAGFLLHYFTTMDKDNLLHLFCVHNTLDGDKLHHIIRMYIAHINIEYDVDIKLPVLIGKTEALEFVTEMKYNIENYMLDGDELEIVYSLLEKIGLI